MTLPNVILYNGTKTLATIDINIWNLTSGVHTFHRDMSKLWTKMRDKVYNKNIITVETWSGVL